MAQSDSYLLVEGTNDQHVIWALCEYYAIPENFDVQRPTEAENVADGLPQLLRNFSVHLKGDRTAVGIVLDADENLAQRWQQAVGVVRQGGINQNLPTAPEPGGTVIEPTADYQPRVGIWLMPDNHSVGRLEDFVRFLIPKGDELVPVTQDALDQIKVAPGQRWSDHHDSKAFIHTWLAWQKVPGMPMGQAITAKALQADSPQARLFADWLRRLFTP